MAKRFFYVCAGLFLLVSVYAFGARRAGAQLGVSQEVAVLQGEVADGGTIPLPHYPNGSEATESECRWIVSPRTVGHDGAPVFLRCSTAGRTVRIYWCRGGCGVPGDCVPNQCAPQGGAVPGIANYLIIAVRSTQVPIELSDFKVGQKR